MTNRPVHRKDFDSEGISIEAASWVLQIDNGPLSREDRVALQEWLSRSPAHERALRDHAAAWMSVDDIMTTAGRAERRLRGFSWHSFGAAMASWRLAWPAVPVLASLIALFYIVMPVTPPTQPDQAVTPISYSTRLGEQAQFKLTDGSVVHLNTSSLVEVEYHPTRRLVRLLKGEAHFDVEPDKARPFYVVAGEKRVSAVGTAFSVRLTPEGLNVVVTEGIVGVAAARPSAGADSPRDLLEKPPGADEFQAILKPNETMIVQQGAAIVEKIEDDEIGRQLSWREGVLKFEDDSLGYVLEEMSRYTDTKVVLADRAMADLRVGGLFKTGEISSLLSALELSFDLEAKTVGPKTIILSFRKTEATGG